MGFALIACERLIILEIILDHFKSMNNTAIIKYAMIDKDLQEDAAIMKSFPEARIL